MNVFNYIFCSFRMCITDKNLSKIIIVHQSDYLGNTVFVLLVKNII